MTAGGGKAQIPNANPQGNPKGRRVADGHEYWDLGVLGRLGFGVWDLARA